MNTRQLICGLFLVGWLAGVPAAAHDCCHYHQCQHECWNSSHHGLSGTQSRGNQAVPVQAAGNLQTLQGRVDEIIYLPGAASDGGMVEVKIQSGGQMRLVRLAPAGFLKQGGLRLREGDSIELKGFPVAAMEGDLTVATEVQNGEMTLKLRDLQGRPVW